MSGLYGVVLKASVAYPRQTFENVAVNGLAGGHYLPFVKTVANKFVCNPPVCFLVPWTIFHFNVSALYIDDAGFMYDGLIVGMIMPEDT